MSSPVQQQVKSTLSTADQQQESDPGTLDLSISSPESPPQKILEGPKVEDVIATLQDPKTYEQVSKFLQETMQHLLTVNVAVELILIGTAMLLGLGFRKLVRPRLLNQIGKLKLPYTAKHVLRNMTKLVMHASALTFLLIAMPAILALQPEWEIKILSAAIKLLTAWIFIRIIVQIILNAFLRNLLAILAWIIAALSILGLLEPLLQLFNALGLNFGGSRITLLDAVKVIIILFLLVALAMFAGRLIEQRLRSSTSLTPSAKVLIGKLIRVTLITLAIIFGIVLSGIDLSSLAIFGGALGLGIGFGLQKVISNLFSGILLLADRSIKPGDIIETQDGTFGWIGQLNARYVSIVTRDNKEYLIPNEDFVTQPVINWSFTNRLIRVETKFGVHYDSDPHLVKQLAEEAASHPERVVTDPPPQCHLVEFGDSSLNFVLRFWIQDAEKGVTNMKGAVMLAIWDNFKENDIKIPYPHREVFLHKEP